MWVSHVCSHVAGGMRTKPRKSRQPLEAPAPESAATPSTLPWTCACAKSIAPEILDATLPRTAWRQVNYSLLLQVQGSRQHSAYLLQPLNSANTSFTPGFYKNNSSDFQSHVWKQSCRFRLHISNGVIIRTTGLLFQRRDKNRQWKSDRTRFIAVRGSF